MQFKQFGKYSVIKKLASGGMADILLSISLSPTGFGRFVVIKKALSKFSGNSDFNEMFKNEAKVACNLKHKNITPIYEFGIEKDQFFLTMEYISGRNLRELSKKIDFQKKELGIDNAVYIVKEVASGLNYAHNAIDSNTGLPLRIIHRDVSPQNIMVSFDGEIKLIDFGIAKITDTNLTKAGHLKGKFSYMSPEQAQGEKLDERTDIFCLGIILWELLTGKRLFASENEMASLKKVRNCNVPSVQKINPKVPTELNNIVMKALSKNKNLRYKTASRMERDLNLFLNKNYPEYSYYNLTFLVKTLYRRDVMKEREKLKSYSSEFKKYINTLNLEKSFSSQEINFNTVNMDIPNKVASRNTATLLKTETKTLGPKSQLSVVNPETDSSLEASYSESQEISLASEAPRKSTQSEVTVPLQEVAEKPVTRTKKTPKVSLVSPESQEESSASQKRDLGEHNVKEEAHKPLPQKENSQIIQHNLSVQSPEQTRKKSISEDFDFQKVNLKNIKRKHTSYTINTSLNKTFDNLATRSSLFQTGLSKTSRKAKKRKFLTYPKMISMFLLIATIGGGAGFFYLSKPVEGGKSSYTPQSSKGSTSSGEVSPTKPGSQAESDSPVQIKPRTQPGTQLGTQGKAQARTQARTQASSSHALSKRVLIQSVPSNASIYIDNRFIKYTPSTIELSTNKIYFITIKKSGYHDKSLSINPNQSKNNIAIRLNREVTRKRNSVIIVK